MELDQVAKAFLNAQTILICLAIYLMTYVIRKVVEGVWVGAKKHRLWREVWLPIGPIVNGGLIGLMAKTFVWPEIVGTSLSGRIMYGAICGVFSALLYSRVRSFIASKTPLPPSKKSVTTIEDASEKETPKQFPSVPPMTSDSPPNYDPNAADSDDAVETPPTGRS